MRGGRCATRSTDDVCAGGYDADRGSFTQYYGSDDLDAALLLLPRVGFLPVTDPRVVGTVEAVQPELTSDGLLLRYRPETSDDGLPGGEGAFLACSFWLVDALCGMGEREQATALFERLLTLRNDVGMLSEEYDPEAGRQLGNTPQAFSLVGLINSASQLSGTRAAHTVIPAGRRGAADVGDAPMRPNRRHHAVRGGRGHPAAARAAQPHSAARLSVAQLCCSATMTGGVARPDSTGGFE